MCTTGCSVAIRGKGLAQEDCAATAAAGCRWRELGSAVLLLAGCGRPEKGGYGQGTGGCPVLHRGEAPAAAANLREKDGV